MLILLLAAQATALNCDLANDAIATSQCALEDSIKYGPDANCKNQQMQLDLNVCSYRDYLRSDIELNKLWAAAVKRRGTETVGKSNISPRVADSTDCSMRSVSGSRFATRNVRSRQARERTAGQFGPSLQTSV